MPMQVPSGTTGMALLLQPQSKQVPFLFIQAVPPQNWQCLGCTSPNSIKTRTGC